MNRTKQKKRIPLIAWIGFGLAVVLLLFNGYSIAKYTAQEKEEPVYAAKSFYFESDLLTESGNEKYTMRTGVDEIIVKIYNYPDALRRSEVDISYEVTLTGPQNETVTGTLHFWDDTENKEKADTATITFDNLAAGTYTVTAKSTSPYSESLSAQFTVVAQGSFTYEVRDRENSPTLLVVVTSTDYEGMVTIDWGKASGVLPDNTDPYLASASGNSYTVSGIQKNSQYSFVFFKTNPATVYTDEHIDVFDVN